MVRCSDGRITTGKTKYSQKNCPNVLCPWSVQHERAWYWTRAFAVENKLLESCSMSVTTCFGNCIRLRLGVERKGTSLSVWSVRKFGPGLVTDQHFITENAIGAVQLLRWRRKQNCFRKRYVVFHKLYITLFPKWSVTKKRKANCVGHILCSNWHLEHIIEGTIEGGIELTGRSGWRRKQLLDDLKQTRGYWKLKEGTLARIQWETRLEESMDLL
jgi:hypothetical protein